MGGSRGAQYTNYKYGKRTTMIHAPALTYSYHPGSVDVLNIDGYLQVHGLQQRFKKISDNSGIFHGMDE